MQTLSVSICAQFALSNTPAQAGQHSSHFVMTIPAAADPGWTLELGRDGGRDRDGSLYCPKTQDSLNAQRVQFPYWSGDLELHHPSAKTDPAPVICPVCLVACLQHAVLLGTPGPHNPATATATAAAAASLCLTCF